MYIEVLSCGPLDRKSCQVGGANHSKQRTNSTTVRSLNKILNYAA